MEMNKKFEYQPDLSKIQADILSRLITSESGLRYAEIKNPETENDLYNYHLQYLVKQNLIEKLEGIYKITSKGLILMSNFDATGKQLELFKVSVALYIFRNVGGQREILLQKRLRRPFIGDHTGISGKVLRGEKTIEAASRKLLEETGLTGKFSKIGILRKIRRDKDCTILEDTQYYICYAESPAGNLIQRNIFGENFWTTEKKAMTLINSNIDLGEHDISIYKRLFKKNVSVFLLDQDTIVQSY